MSRCLFCRSFLFPFEHVACPGCLKVAGPVVVVAIVLVAMAVVGCRSTTPPPVSQPTRTPVAVETARPTPTKPPVVTLPQVFPAPAFVPTPTPAQVAKARPSRVAKAQPTPTPDPTPTQEPVATRTPTWRSRPAPATLDEKTMSDGQVLALVLFMCTLGLGTFLLLLGLRVRSTLAFVVTWLGLSALAAAAHCEPANDGGAPVTPTTRSAFQLRTEAWTLYVATDAKDAAPAFGTRVQASYSLGRLTAAVRYDVSRQKGEEGTLDVAPATFGSSELYGLGAVHVVGPFSVAGVYGLSTPNPGEEGATRDMWLGGLMVGDGTGDRWLLAGYGRNRAVADYVPCTIRQTGRDCSLPAPLLPMASIQFRVAGETSLVGDAAAEWPIRDGSRYQIRGGLSFRVKLNLFGGGD